MLTDDGSVIAGYYSLSQYSVRLDGLPQEMARKLPRYPIVPVTLLGRLARDLRYRGKEVGELLLMDALARCLRASKSAASAAVVVDPKNHSEWFYLKYGFIGLLGTANRLFLPMETIEEMVSE